MILRALQRLWHKAGLSLGLRLWRRTSYMHLLTDTQACSSHSLAFAPRDCTVASRSFQITVCPQLHFSLKFRSGVTLWNKRLFSKSEIKICWEQPSRILHKFKTVCKDKPNGRQALLKYFSQQPCFLLF